MVSERSFKFEVLSFRFPHIALRDCRGNPCQLSQFIAHVRRRCWADSGEAEAAAADIEGNFGKASGVEAWKDGTGNHGSEGAADVADAVEPIVGNFEDDKHATGSKDAEGFGEHLILEFSGFEVVKDKDGEG